MRSQSYGGQRPMSTTEQHSVQTQALPTGTYGADRVHSTVAFEVAYMGIGLFSGTVSDFDAQLADGRLTGAARIATLQTKDENLTGHLMSPDFFDAERHPEVELLDRGGKGRGQRGHVRGRADDQGHHPARDPDGHRHRARRRSLRERALRPRARDDDRPHAVRDHLEQRHAERHEGTRRRGHPQGGPLAREGSLS